MYYPRQAEIRGSALFLATFMTQIVDNPALSLQTIDILMIHLRVWQYLPQSFGKAKLPSPCRRHLALESRIGRACQVYLHQSREGCSMSNRMYVVENIACTVRLPEIMQA